MYKNDETAAMLVNRKNPVFQETSIAADYANEDDLWLAEFCLLINVNLKKRSLS